MEERAGRETVRRLQRHPIRLADEAQGSEPVRQVGAPETRMNRLKSAFLRPALIDEADLVEMARRMLFQKRREERQARAVEHAQGAVFLAADRLDRLVDLVVVILSHHAHHKHGDMAQDDRFDVAHELSHPRLVVAELVTEFAAVDRAQTATFQHRPPLRFEPRPAQIDRQQSRHRQDGGLTVRPAFVDHHGPGHGPITVRLGRGSAARCRSLTP
jgi:hypothetical protein